MSTALPSHVARPEIPGAQRVVVKIGTRVLTGDAGSFDRGIFGRLAEALCALSDSGREVIIVSSGAVGLGMELLGLRERPKDLPRKQAAAALGQALLMGLYGEHFAAHGRHVGQILLSHADVADRKRYLNARHTLQALLRLRAIPVINENDSVAVEEIMFGDNDTLSALVAGLVAADLLVILTDIEGFYDRDPSEPDARLVSRVERLTPAHLAAAQGSRSAVGTGGMLSKLLAVRKAHDAGVPVVIARGRRDAVLEEVISGRDVGTFFPATARRLPARKQWIGHARKVRGALGLDAGAAEAVGRQGKSLLPAGIRAVEGEFHAGDLVEMRAPDGALIARGLVAYDAADVRRIAGRQVREIESVLGFRTTDEVVHRDDMVTEKREPGA